MKFKLFFVLIVCSTVLFSQEDKLKLHSISSMPLGIYFESKSYGPGASIDLSFSQNKNIYKLFVSGGTFIGYSEESNKYWDVDLLYGREFAMNKWLAIDVFGGLGHIEHTTFINEKSDIVSTVGFPIQGRIRFQFSKFVSMGMQFHTNINSVKTVYNIGPFIQWQFRKSKKGAPKVEENSN